MGRTTENLKWHVAWFRPKPGDKIKNYHICDYNGQYIANSLSYKNAVRLVNAHNSSLDLIVKGQQDTRKMQTEYIAGTNFEVHCNKCNGTDCEAVVEVRSGPVTGILIFRCKDCEAREIISVVGSSKPRIRK